MMRHLGTALNQIWTVRGTEPVLELQASAGLPTHPREAWEHIPIGRFEIGGIAADREPRI